MLLLKTKAAADAAVFSGDSPGQQHQSLTFKTRKPYAA
jgi:hypothetical protein